MGHLRRAGACAAVVAAVALGACGKPALAPVPAPAPMTIGASVPGPGLVWYQKGADTSFRPTDWSGHLGQPFATPAAPPGMPHYPGKPAPTQLFAQSVSPDGSRIVFNDGSVRGSDGAVVGRIDPNAGLVVVWADDNRHYCQMTTPDYHSFPGGILIGPAVLTWGAVGSAPKRLAAVGRFGANAVTTIEACSARTGTAVLAERTASALTQTARTGLDPVTRLDVISLSDGTVLYQRDYAVTRDPIGGTVVTASSDGRYVAEVFTVVRQGPAAKVQIRALPQGNVVATMKQTKVQGFSGDDNLLLVGGADKPDAHLVSWRTGQVIRTEPGVLALSATQPEGSGFMVLKQATENGLLVNDLWLLPASGESRLIDSDILEVYSS